LGELLHFCKFSCDAAPNAAKRRRVEEAAGLRVSKKGQKVLDLLEPGEKQDLLCIGNAIVDFFAAADSEFAKRHGILKPAQHLECGPLAAAIGELGERSSICSGGGAANVAKIAAILGMKAAFIGAVGSDEWGRFFEEELRGAGVQPLLFPRKSPTGRCLILRLDKETVRVAAAPSASLELTREDVGKEDIRNAGVVVIDGFLMGRQDLVRHILDSANRSGTAVALDIGSPGIARERAHEILTYSRIYPLILFMNEAEAISFFRTLNERNDGGEAGEEGEFHEEMTDFFLGLTANELFPIVAVKRGKRGALVFAGGTVHRETTFAVKPRDSTGAGDAFCAAFLSAWIRDKTLGECAALGNKVAREVLAVSGTAVNRKKIAALGKPLGKA
jgi:sugar/nucleoside kinase (ribokinase family)